MSPDLWTAYWAFVGFVFGAIVGSFLNVCIWRLPRGESLAGPPSHCPACGHRLRLLPDMVPLVSQVWYRSRCRYCGERFSWRYFWVELLTAAVFTGCYLRFGAHGAPALGEAGRTVSALLAMGFAAALIAILFIDLEHYEIPDVAVLGALAFAVGRDALLIWRGVRPLWVEVPGTPWLLPLPGSILAGGIAFWLLWQFAALSTAAMGKEAMGAGDALLLAAMGAFLIPWPLLAVAFLLAVFLGTVGGVASLLWASSLARRRCAAQGEAPAEAGGWGGDGDAAGERGECDAEAARTVDSTGRGDEVGGGEVLQAVQDDNGGGAGKASAEPEIPTVPPGARWGRLLTVVGTWALLAALWGGAALAARQPATGVALGVTLAVAAALLLRIGIREWVSGDRAWLPAMDELFAEGNPGPRFIPFGPYLVVGTFIAMLWGRSLVAWYAEQVGLGAPGGGWE